MAEYGANASQLVPPGETVVFTNTMQPCLRGFVRHRDGTGNFLLSGWVPRYQNVCCCRRRRAQYRTSFGANIAIPTGGTVEAISVAFTIDGATVPTTQMIVTPTAVEEYFNVSRETTLDIFNNCCESVAVRNTSSQPILVQNANITFSRPDLAVTY